MDISKAKCPECGKPMTPVVCLCGRCNVRIEGEFEVSPLARLSSDDQALAIAFIRSYGSIKSLQEALGVSYPTARNRLEALVAQLDKAMSPPNSAGRNLGDSFGDHLRRSLEPLKDIKAHVDAELAPLKDLGKHIRDHVHRHVKTRVKKHIKVNVNDQAERAREAEEVLRKLEAGEIDVRQALEEL